ncbi:cyclase family protein [bacterium]|nr:cyclase family protein [bacterium]
MRIIDLTGPMYHGMWTYGPPYPRVVVEEIPQPEFIEYPTYSWRFELGAQTGTYLETSLHMYREGPRLVDIPVESLFMIPTAVIKVDVKPLTPITVAQLEAAAPEINEGETILVATGWSDDHWHHSDMVSACPHFEGPAMHWILDHKPSMMAGDMPRFDSWDDPQHFFQRFFQMGTLLLAPLFGVRQITAARGKLVALPMKLDETCAAPCRVLFIEE